MSEDYLVFPFGKYKGVRLEELPSTYIVFALESFNLNNELKDELWRILSGKMGTYSSIQNHLVECMEQTNDDDGALILFMEFLNERIRTYE